MTELNSQILTELNSQLLSVHPIAKGSRTKEAKI